jgi:predicted ArsR family transcriptional regulator
VVGRVDGTREEILALLRRRERMGVEDLARELGLAGATVRRHLDVLQRDAYVEVTQVRGRTGRPRHLFSLTEAGAELFPHHYVRMTHRLLGEIVDLAKQDTSGRDGREIASLVFSRMADRIAREYAPQVTGATTPARVASAVALVGAEGIDFEVVPGEDGVRLYGRGCLCGRTGDSPSVASCEHDRSMLEQLIGAPVRPLDASEVPHDFQCGYLVMG